MSAEASTPQPDLPRPRLRVVKSNRSQILLFSILTLILTAATVWGGRIWLRNSETLIFADSESSVALVRTILELSESPDAATRVQMAPPGSTFDKLFASGFGAVVAVAHASRIMTDKSYEQYAKRGIFTLNAIDSAKALARKYPVLSEE